MRRFFNEKKIKSPESGPAGRIKLHNFSKIFIVLAFFLTLLLVPISAKLPAGTDYHPQDIKSLMNSGKKLLSEGNFEQSLEFLSKALNLASAAGDGKNKIDCLMNLGLLHWNTGQIEESSEFYKQALSLAEKLNLTKKSQECHKILEIFSLYNEGKKLRSAGKMPESIQSFEKAIIIAREIGSQYHELKCLRQSSISYLAISDIKNYLGVNQQCLEISRSLNHRIETGYALNNIANYHTKEGNYSHALSNYLEALEIARKLKNKTDISINLKNIANIYFFIGEFKKSLDFFSEALEMDKQTGNNKLISHGHNNLGIIFKNLASISEDKSDYYKALSHFSECLELSQSSKNKRMEIMSLNNIGSIYLDMNKYHIALRYFKRALKKAEGGRHISLLGMALNNTGFTYLNLPDYQEAESAFAEAIMLGEKSREIMLLWEAYFGLGQCVEKQKKYDLAVESYKKSIEIIDRVKSQIVLDVEKVGYFRRKFKVYECLIDLYYKQLLEDSSKKTAMEIYNLVEKAKAASFLEILKESQTDIYKKLPEEMREREKELSDKILGFIKILSGPDISEKERAEINNKLFEAEDRYNALISEMRQENPEVAAIIAQKPCPIESIQDKVLDKETIILEYFLGEKMSLMFLISNDSFKIFPLPSREEILNSMKPYLKIISDTPIKDFRSKSEARRFYNMLLQPTETEISNSVKNLVIIPDGVLHYMPFETLVMKDPDPISEKNYLISKYTISYSPSASLLFYLKNEFAERQYSKDFLGFGNSSHYFKPSREQKKHKNPAEILMELYKGHGYSLSPIPYTVKEVKKIAKFFPGKKRDIYLENEASENTVKNLPLDEYRIIHFACHAFLDEVFPFRSALVLTAENSVDEDGFLTVREIYNLRLQPELVVLSACQTGRGKIEKGEGIFGLPRTFFYAGARSVVSTLWNVADKSSAQFMHLFYQFLSEGKSKSQSLRLAKLEMMKNGYSHPYYWAAFILNGEY